MRLVYGVLVSAMLIGCADTHQLRRVPGTNEGLSRQASAYVAVPQDGRYGAQPYPGSGGLVAQAVAVAFEPYLTSTTAGVKREDFDAALQSAREAGFTYLLYPEILHWEDRATEWSARPDQASVKVSIVRADTGAVIDSAVVGGKSGVATFGGDRPEDLLPKPLADYAAALFNRNN